jgi:hypothetical protein
MNIWKNRLQQTTAACAIVLIVMPCAGTRATFGQQASSSQQSASVSDSPPPAAPTPNSAAPMNSAGAGNPQTTPPTTQSQGNQDSAPVGTAVAPYEKGIGVAASRPAGAVIAPAKQRRTRSFLIKVSVLVAAGVAVGTVVALSNASPSRPN